MPLGRQSISVTLTDNFWQRGNQNRIRDITLTENNLGLISPGRHHALWGTNSVYWTHLLQRHAAECEQAERPPSGGVLTNILVPTSETKGWGTRVRTQSVCRVYMWVLVRGGLGSACYALLSPEWRSGIFWSDQLNICFFGDGAVWILSDPTDPMHQLPRPIAADIRQNSIPLVLRRFSDQTGPSSLLYGGKSVFGDLNGNLMEEWDDIGWAR